MTKHLLILLFASLAVVCWAQDEGKVIAPEGGEAVPAEPGKLAERWGYGHSYGYGHRNHYYHYNQYGNAGYYYPYYNRWYYRDGKPVPEDKAPPAPTSEPEDSISFPGKTKRSTDKVIAPEGGEAVPAEAGKLGERWGHGYHGYRHSYYYYPSYGYGGYYYPYYNRWYYRDGTPVPEDKAPPAPTSEPEETHGAKVKRSTDKVIAPEGEEAVPAEPGKLAERWGYGHSYGHGHRHHYYHYNQYGNAGYYYPYYNRWYYRDGKPVPEDKAPPAPTSEPEDSISFPGKTKRSADKVIAPEGGEAVPAEAGKLGERWGHGYHGYRHSYYYYPSYGYGGYYYPYYNRWYYRDGKPVPEDKAPPAPTSEPEEHVGAKVKRSTDIYGFYPYPYQIYNAVPVHY